MRFRQRSRLARGRIDFRDPLTDHPVNENRVFWWNPLPGRFGGPVTWDLCQQIPITLNNFASPYGWSTASYPGGSGSILSNLNSSPANYLSVPANYFQYTSVTANAWFNMTVLSSNNDLGIVRKDTTAAGNRMLWGIVCNNNSGNVAAQYYNSAVGTVFNATSGTLNYAEWYMATMVLNAVASTIALYINGALVATTTITGAIAAPTGVMAIGAQPPFNGGGAGAPFAGPIADVTILDYPVAAWWPAATYRLGPQRYPGAIRRRRARAWSVPSAPPATAAESFLQRRVFTYYHPDRTLAEL